MERYRRAECFPGACCTESEEVEWLKGIRHVLPEVWVNLDRAGDCYLKLKTLYVRPGHVREGADLPPFAEWLAVLATIHYPDATVRYI